MQDTTFPLVFLAVCSQITLDQERKTKRSKLMSASSKHVKPGAQSKKPMPFLIKHVIKRKF